MFAFIVISFLISRLTVVQVRCVMFVCTVLFDSGFLSVREEVRGAWRYSR